ncbi:SAVED domain-containing protein [Leucothrix sargassi]|nr:SAVED domain-containing protein [Leucothrix sargassi]
MKNLHSITNNNDAVDDLALTEWLKNYRSQSKEKIAYVYTGSKCKMFEVGDSEALLTLVNPEKSAIKELKSLAKEKRLKRLELTPNEFNSVKVSNLSWSLLQVTVADLSAWYKSRENKLSQGRGKAISPTTAALVWHDAGGRCMYRGCAKDLGETPLTTKRARIAYLAHIIGSDPDGPRGNDKSHELSDDPENIMLMCDAHHRLIDRIDEEGHSIELLQSMRAEHTESVNYLLNSLKYPRAQVITLLSDLAQVSTHVSESMLQEATLYRNLVGSGNTIHAIRRTQRDDRSRKDFWWHFLNEHENDIRDFIRQISSQSSQGLKITPDVLAIFPLHLVPVLFMAGRIVGEARSVEVFQYDRGRNSWSWSEAAKPSAPDDFFISGVVNGSYDEVVLSLELTAEIDICDLPESLFLAITEKKTPWIRIRHKLVGPNCIQCSDDLESFTRTARKNIQLIQDEMKAKQVHLVGVSPASTLFRFGQLLQAGHHPSYHLYDRSSRKEKFSEAFTIDGTCISKSRLDSEDPFKISLR